ARSDRRRVGNREFHEGADPRPDGAQPGDGVAFDGAEYPRLPVLRPRARSGAPAESAGRPQEAATQGSQSGRRALDPDAGGPAAHEVARAGLSEDDRADDAAPGPPRRLWRTGGVRRQADAETGAQEADADHARDPAEPPAASRGDERPVPRVR